jgi:hypothetical protein
MARNDCILYHGEEYENLNVYPICRRYMHALMTVYHGEEYENLNVYPIYNALWYKIRRDNSDDIEGEHPKKRVLPNYKVYSNVEHEWTRN